MNIKKISQMLIFTLLAHTGIAAERSQSKVFKDSPISNTLVSKSDLKIWMPTNLNQYVDSLPPNYLGLDRIKFHKLFKSKLESFKKNDFETTEAFTQRTAHIDSLLSPINTTDTYAFQITDITAEYNADKQIYTLQKYGSQCEDVITNGQDKDMIMCKVGPVSRVVSTYVGSNSYGVTRVINRTRGLDFSLAILKDSALTKTVYTKPFSDSFPISLEKALNLKNLEIGVLFVGRITDAKIFEGRGISVNPKVDLPIDKHITEEAVPFEVKKLIYYVIKTGEILVQRVF